MSLLSKTLLALVVVALLPLIWSSSQLIGVNREAIRDQVLRVHALTARACMGQIDGDLETKRSVLRGVAEHPVFQEAPQSQMAQELIASLLSGDGRQVAALAILYDESGNEVMRAQPKGFSLDFGPTPAIDREPLLIDTDQGVFLRLNALLSGRDAQIVAFYDVSAWLQILDPQEVGEQAQLCLMDEKGRVVLADHAELQVPDLLRDQAMHGKVSGAIRTDNTSFSVLGAFAPSVQADWRVVSWQPRAVAEAIERRMRNRTFVALAGALFLVGLIALWAFRAVIQPIRNLLHEHSDLLGQISPKSGGDEVSQLQRAFQALERLVKGQAENEQIVLGRYEVTKRIGEGAMGTVFRGWDPKLKRDVALKTIRLNRQTDADFELSNQLMNEAISAARINHEHVVGVYDVEDAPDTCFVTMEYVDGLSLEEYIWANHQLEEEEAVQLALAVTKGLNAAHQRGILHRDIKPANVLLSRHGDIKIADFGISQMMTQIAKEKGAIFGTPGYLPPETLSGKGFSEKGDLFAVGVLLYRSVTGREPFTGKDRREAMMHTLIHDPKPPNQFAKISDELNRIILKLLEKNPDQRFATAQALIDALEPLVRNKTWQYQITWGGKKHVPVQTHGSLLLDSSDLQQLPATEGPGAH